MFSYIGKPLIIVAVTKWHPYNDLRIAFGAFWPFSISTSVKGFVANIKYRQTNETHQMELIFATHEYHMVLKIKRKFLTDGIDWRKGNYRNIEMWFHTLCLQFMRSSRYIIALTAFVNFGRYLFTFFYWFI